MNSNAAVKPQTGSKTSRPEHFSRRRCTELDRIISKLKTDYNGQDVFLIITPASKHIHLYKLYVVQRHKQGEFCMTTITQSELSCLKASKTFRKYCVVLSSRYIDLKQMILHTETIKSLINRKCSKDSKETMTSQINLLNNSKSISTSAGDYFKGNATKVLIIKDSSIQTDPEIENDVIFSASDVNTLIEAICSSAQSSKHDIERFFFMADKMNFALVVRPLLLWRSSNATDKDQDDIGHLLLESYLPGNFYLGCICMLESDLWPALSLYPKLLFSIHVVEDVYEIIPWPRKLVNALRTVLVFLKLELLYDALGELTFDWYKNLTFL